MQHSKKSKSPTRARRTVHHATVRRLQPPLSGRRVRLEHCMSETQQLIAWCTRENLHRAVMGIVAWKRKLHSKGQSGNARAQCTQRGYVFVPNDAIRLFFLVVRLLVVADRDERKQNRRLHDLESRRNVLQNTMRLHELESSNCEI